MKKFEFPLEGLLRVRKVETDQHRAELQRRLQRMRQLQIELENIAALRAREQERGRELREGVLQVGDLRAGQSYLNQLQREDQEKRNQLASLQTEVAAAQEDVATAQSRQRVVERLKEERYAEYLEEVRKQESVDLEEASQALRGLLPTGVQRETSDESWSGASQEIVSPATMAGDGEGGRREDLE